MGNIALLFGQKLYNFSSNRRIAFPGLLRRKLICETVTRVIWDTKMQLSIFDEMYIWFNLSCLSFWLKPKQIKLCVTSFVGESMVER